MTAPQWFDADAVRARLTFPALVDRLAEAFADPAMTVPMRHHHTVPVPDAPDATLLLMPAWRHGKHLGLKSVTVFPGNGRRSLPAIMGVYLLMSGETGAPIALLDGPMLTVRRTAAASALAARFLARKDAHRLTVIGTGALAPHLAEAHASVRPIRHITIAGRTLDKAQQVAAQLAPLGLTVEATTDIADAVRRADVISCATLAQEPVVRGDWLSPGAHLDLVGGFTPTMRETDDRAITRAELYCDTRAGALHEAGDLVQPLKSGLISEASVRGDLFELVRGQALGRRDDTAITLFKSVGTAIEDLAAAELAVGP
ncbi:ornithine cyclodeaminase [Elstera cyanobacteriorum]|uniref:Ornithine cyclodeaminase n=1 Tax=Elstera cyanobacteriorum TaxID=2022747 RepID=A0A255XLZ6_9PROT|nr:ornithine cyclodeaminase family protein [Elstera cyanobacteriorum]OYQ17932.1 ornithine cyclodeaminase [Elstera cyanobacteriorum]GFZ85048.1 ornithine cyclodeaminase [Elstera cyanobacteriorum]